MSPERRAIMPGRTAWTARHIDVDDPVPFLGVAASDISGDVASRISEQNVDGTELVGGRFDHGRDVGRLREAMARAVQFEPSSSANVFNPSAERARSELPPFRRKSFRGRGATAGACSGHDHRLILQTSVHAQPSQPLRDVAG